MFRFSGNDSSEEGLLRRRTRRHRSPSCDSAEEGIPENEILQLSQEVNANAQWKRILLLVSKQTKHCSHLKTLRKKIEKYSEINLNVIKQLKFY